MALILGIVIGVLIGAGLVYMQLKATIDKQQQQIKQNQRIISDLEKRHASRMKETVQSLQNDYARQLDQQKSDLSQRYETRIQNLTKIPADTQPSESSSATPVSTDSSASPASSPPPSPPTASPSSSPALSPPSPIPTPPDDPRLTRPGLSLEQRQELANAVLTMGQSKQMTHLPELRRLSTFSAGEVREAVALSLGEIATAYPGSPVARQVIPLLGKLSQDPNPSVRYAAVSALGQLPSVRSVPFLRRSLRDSDTRVVKAASSAMERLKYHKRSASTRPATRKKNFKSTRQ